MPVGTTTALLISAGAAAIGTGYGIYSGEQAASAQRKAMRHQKAAQDAAEGRAARQEQAAVIEQRRAARRAPDLMALFDAERRRAGTSSTMVSGGVDPAALKLGQASSLGGV